MRWSVVGPKKGRAGVAVARDGPAGAPGVRSRGGAGPVHVIYTYL